MKINPYTPKRVPVELKGVPVEYRKHFRWTSGGIWHFRWGSGGVPVELNNNSTTPQHLYKEMRWGSSGGVKL
jgi:hypothetical protein